MHRLPPPDDGEAPTAAAALVVGPVRVRALDDVGARHGVQPTAVG